MPPIKLVAHRGYQRRFPENTLLSYIEAIKGGAQFVETDVQLSADGHPVLYHDRTLERCSGARGAVQDYSLAQLIRTPKHEPLRFGGHYLSQTITPLSDLVTLLTAHPNVHAFIEVKSSTIDFHGVDTVYQRITETLTPIAQQCTLISFHIAFIAYARNAGWHSLGLALHKWQDQYKAEVAAVAPEYLFIDYDILPEQKHFGDIDCKLVIYEIDDPEVARSLHQRGINYIETFAIVELQQALNQTPESLNG